MKDVVDAIYSRDRKRSVLVVRRLDGNYSYDEEYHFKNELAEIEGWASLGGHSVIYNSLETAKREVPFNVSWLAAEARGPQPAVQPEPEKLGTPVSPALEIKERL